MGKPTKTQVYPPTCRFIHIDSSAKKWFKTHKHNDLKPFHLPTQWVLVVKSMACHTQRIISRSYLQFLSWSTSYSQLTTIFAENHHHFWITLNHINMFWSWNYQSPHEIPSSHHPNIKLRYLEAQLLALVFFGHRVQRNVDRWWISAAWVFSMEKWKNGSDKWDWQKRSSRLYALADSSPISLGKTWENDGKMMIKHQLSQLSECFQTRPINMVTDWGSNETQCLGLGLVSISTVYLVGQINQVINQLSYSSFTRSWC